MKSCFVIIGYSKKPSYANGKLRMLDLDETYTLLIKPVFDELGISCYRAIDKNLSGSIDKMMLEEIKNADIALADISTLNPNVMWELGVRHALKPYHTIMICEKEEMKNIPFDVNHFVVHQYTHSEEGIPYKEVNRFKSALSNVIRSLLDQKPVSTDSPVFTFLQQEDSATKDRVKRDMVEEKKSEVSFAELMRKAEEAKKNKAYRESIELFGIAREFAESSMSLKDSVPFIVARQALCTYKSKEPNEKTALLNAMEMLEELQPDNTNDVEILGLCGAIHKRLFEITNDPLHLESAISFYEKGFRVKQDYYNGINTAFMLYKKAMLQKQADGEWEDTRIQADYLRNSVLQICRTMEAEDDFSEKEDALWILLTIAEAWHYKGDTQKQREYEEKARNMAEIRKDTFAMTSYEEQSIKIDKIMDHLK